jgi:dUTP pyrophosphatase
MINVYLFIIINYLKTKILYYLMSKFINIQVLNNDLIDLYKNPANYKDDSGIDIFTPTDYIIKKNSLSNKICLGIRVEPCNFHHGYYLYPRSSISKTPLRLCNSVGIIDYGYRGEIIAYVDNHSDEDFIIKKNTSYFQLCSPDLNKFFIKNIYTSNIENPFQLTERNNGGFGSTNKK